VLHFSTELHNFNLIVVYVNRRNKEEEEEAAVVAKKKVVYNTLLCIFSIENECKTNSNPKQTRIQAHTPCVSENCEQFSLTFFFPVNWFG
jgi:hypothetical protein